MPNPPFQPLTLSVEQLTFAYGILDDPTANRTEVSNYRLLLRECEAQAQEAASLRQRLKEADYKLRQQESVIARITGILSDRGWTIHGGLWPMFSKPGVDADAVGALRHEFEQGQAQLEQAQKERDETQAALVKLTADIPKTEKRLEQTAAKATLRASQAEAALKEMQKRLETQARMTIAQCELAEERFVLMDEFEAWLRDFAEKGLSPHVTSVLAELQRRRSAPGKDRKGELT